MPTASQSKPPGGSRCSSSTSSYLSRRRCSASASLSPAWSSATAARSSPFAPAARTARRSPSSIFRCRLRSRLEASGSRRTAAGSVEDERRGQEAANEAGRDLGGEASRIHDRPRQAARCNPAARRRVRLLHARRLHRAGATSQAGEARQTCSPRSEHSTRPAAPAFATRASTSSRRTSWTSPPGTRAFIANCNHLLDRCVAQASRSDPAEIRDDVIFFADEGARGRWGSTGRSCCRRGSRVSPGPRGDRTAGRIGGCWIAISSIMRSPSGRPAG